MLLYLVRLGSSNTQIQILCHLICQDAALWMYCSCCPNHAAGYLLVNMCHQVILIKCFNVVRWEQLLKSTPPA